MKDLVVVDKVPPMPIDWDYDASVVRCKNLFKQVREQGASGLTELYIAHQLLTEDSKKKIGRKWPDKTFETYCQDIEIHKDTAYEWLHKYFNLPRIVGIPTIRLLPEGKFDVILADPPWRYDFDVKSRATEKHYPSLLLDEISFYRDKSGVAVQDKFGSDAILFLWATCPKLNEALQVIQDWGFTYKTNMVWIKDKIGLGWYCRNKHELLLIAEKGDMPLPRQDIRPPSVIDAPRTDHSRKPNIREMIQKMYPAPKYLELFGLGKSTDNWVVWGNDYYKK